MVRRRPRKPLQPWCWYCDRSFIDEGALIRHQRAKHFKCTHCKKQLVTVRGLGIHFMQVHKEQLKHVRHSRMDRDNVQLEILGMEGVPQKDIDAKLARHKAAQKRRLKAKDSETNGADTDARREDIAEAAKQPAVPRPDWYYAYRGDDVQIDEDVIKHTVNIYREQMRAYNASVAAATSMAAVVAADATAAASTVIPDYTNPPVQIGGGEHHMS